MKSAETVRRALDLQAQGKTQSDIAYELGVGTSSVSRWLKLGSGAITPSRALRATGLCPERCQFRDAAGEEYAYLLGQYLGDGWIGSNWPRGVHRLEVACCADYPGIIEEVEQAIGAVLPMNAVGRRPRPGVTLVSSYSKHWPCLFPQHGPGKKHERPIVLKPWQVAVALDRYPGKLARGLIHSDGWRGTNRGRGQNGKVYEYSRYQFCNVSDDIRALFAEACARLGVEVKRMNRYNVAVNKRAHVARLDEFVGPKH